MKTNIILCWFFLFSIVKLETRAKKVIHLTKIFYF